MCNIVWIYAYMELKEVVWIENRFESIKIFLDIERSIREVYIFRAIVWWSYGHGENFLPDVKNYFFHFELLSSSMGKFDSLHLKLKIEKMKNVNICFRSSISIQRRRTLLLDIFKLNIICFSFKQSVHVNPYLTS